MKRLFLLSLIALLACAYAQASSNLYYGALRAESAPAAGGRVYAGTTPRTDSLATAMTSKLQSTETMDGEVVFYAYAQASSGWSFAGWSSAPDGAVTRTENPLAVSVACRAKNENVPTTDTVYALFRELQSTMLTLEAPTLLDGSAGGGSYTAQFSDGTNITVTDQARSHATGGTVTLTAQPASNTKLFGWQKTANGSSEYISYEDTLRNYGFAEDCTVRAIFVSEDTPLWEVKGQFGRYANLNEAISGSQNPDSKRAVITLVSAGTLQGSYIIPDSVCLLIPFDKQSSCYRTAPVMVTYIDPLFSQDCEEYTRLTMAPNSRLEVHGELSVSSKMRSSQGENPVGCGNPIGYYGCINMQTGSNMVIETDGKLYCWGYVIGNGEITAKNGSVVYEGFQFPVYRGGNGTNTMAGSKKHVFPLNQYYIQNIETPLSLLYGAELRVYTSVTMEEPPQLYNASAVFVGEEGLFRPAEGTTIRKRYDPLKDRQIYEIDGNTELTQIQLSIGGYIVNSDAYVLPITNNMDIHLHSGTTTVQHQLALLADASITIDEDAVLRLKDSTYIYDKDEWLRGMYTFNDYLNPVIYSPTRQFLRDSSNLTDAKLDVNGTLLVDSAFYTTKGGANICSSMGTGRIVFNHVSPAADTTWQVEQEGSHVNFKYIPCTAPKLRNAERYAGTGAEYLLTGGARQLAMSNEQLAIGGVQPGDTIYAHNGHWGWLRSWEDEASRAGASSRSSATLSLAMSQSDVEDERSNDYRPDGELSMSEAQMSVAQGQIDGGTSYPRSSAKSAVSPSSEEEDIYKFSNFQIPQLSARAVYAAVCALTEEDLPELPFDTEHFIPERTIYTGEACVFLGWTDAERDEANQQITTYAQWNCPEEPVDAIEEIEIGGNKEQETRNKKILRDGEIVIITPYHEYNILGVRIR